MKLSLTVLLVLSYLTILTVAIRDINTAADNIAAMAKVFEEDASMVDCWNALLELKSCSNEIILFFLNGKSYLGLECCKAIRTITYNCWPNMLTSLGYTAEEGDILRDYCGDGGGSSSPSPQPHPDRVIIVAAQQGGGN